MRISGYDVYITYLSLKSHFTQKKYDYFKYRGKVKSSHDTFMSRKDKYQFEKISKKYDEDDIVKLFVSNFIKGKKWIGEFIDETSIENLLEFKKRQESFSYHFKEELSDKNLNTIFRRQKGEQYPEIVTLYMSGDISLETLCVLNKFVYFKDKFDAMLGDDDPIWSPISLLLVKIQPFVVYEHRKIKSILTELLKNRA